jgi:hypothetical protein
MAASQGGASSTGSGKSAAARPARRRRTAAKPRTRARRATAARSNVDRYAVPAITAAVGLAGGAIGGLLLGRRSARAHPEVGVERASADQFATGLGRRLGHAGRRGVARLAGELRQRLEQAERLD